MEAFSHLHDSLSTAKDRLIRGTARTEPILSLPQAGFVQPLDVIAGRFRLADRRFVLQKDRDLYSRPLGTTALNGDFPSHLAHTFLHADETHAFSLVAMRFSDRTRVRHP